MPLEIELKLALPPTALAATLAHPLIKAAPREHEPAVLDSTYFDTPDLALHARKTAVRVRQHGERQIQTVKCAARSRDGLAHRPEWEQSYQGQFDFSAINDVEAAALLESVKAVLVPVFLTRFHRDTRRYAPRPGVEILIMIDTGEVQARGKAIPISEVELELVAGDSADLVALATELQKTLPLTPDDVSKAERGYALFLA
jgi:adenylate cyclase